MTAWLFKKSLFTCNQILEAIIEALFVDSQIQYEYLAWEDCMFHAQNFYGLGVVDEHTQIIVSFEYSIPEINELVLMGNLELGWVRVYFFSSKVYDTSRYKIDL